MHGCSNAGRAARVAALVGGCGALLLTAAAVAPVRAAGPDWATPARGRFLIAHPALADPNFSRTVVLLTGHGPDGSMGLVINRPTEVKLSDAVPELSGTGNGDRQLFVGGPVEPHGLFMLLRSATEPERSALVFDDVYLTRDPTLVDRVIQGEYPAPDFRIYAGYAGWGAGQLDAEIARGDWRVVRADAGSLFYDDELLWQRLVPPDPRRSAELRPGRAAPGRGLRHDHRTSRRGRDAGP